MPICLINPNPSSRGINEATVCLPLGIGYIAAVLEQNGFACRIIDANVQNLSTDSILSALPPDVGLIGISLNSFGYRSAQNLCRSVKNVRPNVPIVIGGPLPSASPTQVLQDFACDGVIRGEGEYSFLRLATNLSAGLPLFAGEVSGACRRDESGQIVEQPISRIADLDKIPFPAYHLFPPLRHYRTRSRKSPAVSMVTSRGCTYQCSFCSKDVFSRHATFRSPENVLTEIDWLVRNLGVRQIDIVDDNFAQNRKHMECILDGLRQRRYDLALNLQSGIRTETLDEALLRKMKEAGFYKIAFGIESVDPEVLRLCRKNLDLKKVEESVRLAKSLGLVTYGFFIVGLPGETESGFQRTLDFAKRLDFDIANFCLAVPFPGTTLWEQVKTGGRFLIDTQRGIESGFYGGRVFFEYGDNKEAEIIKRYRKSYREFYGFKRWINLIRSMRSWGEFRWLLSAVKFVGKGLLNS